ncbi:MAG: photosystem reaction center subunit H [Firmicutes bacterium HGW-Firmicutes-8]|nr:MAG: photosystem reaction center subunit H [Firmicutes bacterium HGW-Firmicutes-8]
MRRSRKFISMPIVSLEEGLQIGSVRSLVVDPVKMEIAAIIIDQRGWFREQKIIPYSKVKHIGNDAITIDKSSNVQKVISLPEILKLVKERANPIGTKVIAENGTVLGLVDEYYINELTGEIISLEISGKLLESLFKGKALLGIEQVRTMGTDVIVVKDGSESQLEKIDGGLQETIHNIKEGTSTIWESTKQRTKKISKNIKVKYEKKEKDTETEQPLEPNPDLDIVSEIEIRNEDVLPEVKDPGQLDVIEPAGEDTAGHEFTGAEPGSIEPAGEEIFSEETVSKKTPGEEIGGKKPIKQ